MGELAALVRKHPELIAVAVVAVALIAWMQSRGSPTVDGDVVFVGGGSGNGSIDPGVVAIEEARINAGAQNLGTLAQLVLGSQQSSDSSGVYFAQIGAGRDVEMARTASGERTDLARTAAEREVGLASVSASLGIADINANVANTAARITAETQAAVTAANLQAAGYARDVQNFQTQAGKDIERARDNTNIVTSIFSTIGDVVSGIFGWF